MTFLFTDIEGSTRLWEARPDAMSVALARHDELLRKSFRLHDGHVFKTVGDAFCVAFRTAPAALKAALDAQRSLHAEAWPAQVGLRSRMALHTGAVERRDGDYFGAPLNRVARLLAAGHGGQTLLSESTHDLCRDQLPALARVKPLGEHGLKDLSRRESVFQLCHPDLPQDFPPLKTTLAPLDRETPSIAVLPFANMSRDEDNEYFAEGLAEELTNVLSRIRGLRVASRTSAFFFKGKDIDIPTVAQKLGVATVLEGSVRKAGNRVRITTQLVEVATDSHLWSATYDRELDDIFAVQDDIAQSVVKQLRATLRKEPRKAPSGSLKAEVRAATTVRVRNAEAYRLYLQGRFLVARRTQDAVTQGARYLREALALDAQFAEAWAALAYAQTVEAGSWTTSARDYENARASAQRALAIEPELAEGHIVLAAIQMGHDWDWPGSEASMRRALAVAPHNVDVLLAAALECEAIGRLDEAIDICRRAIALDPLNVTGHRYLGMLSQRAGSLADAEASFKEAIELNPIGGMSYRGLGEVYLEQGRFAEALGAFEQESHEAFRLLGLAVANHALGRRKPSVRALEELGSMPVHAYLNAQANAYCGNIERAFEWLERAYAQRNPGLPQMKREFLLRRLHDDPRWDAFVAKMKLP